MLREDPAGKTTTVTEEAGLKDNATVGTEAEKQVGETTILIGLADTTTGIIVTAESINTNTGVSNAKECGFTTRETATITTTVI